MHRLILLAATAALLAGGSAPALALSSKECSAKFKTATADGTAAGRKYADYRKAECGAGASATTTAPSAAAAPAPSAPAARSGAASTGGYPTAIDPRYASESPGKGREHTCLDAYKAAKAAGTLGSRRWIQKGGGYYSECNKALKGA